MQKDEVDEAAAVVDGGPHGHLSAFQVGDYVAHRDSPRIVFKVVEILEAVPAELGDHLLGCVLEQDVRKYHERDLVRVDLEPVPSLQNPPHSGEFRTGRRWTTASPPAVPAQRRAGELASLPEAKPALLAPPTQLVYV